MIPKRAKLKTVLSKRRSPEESTNLKFTVRILKQYSENIFLIADDSGYCELVLRDPKPLHRLLILENNCVKIVNPEIVSVYDEIVVNKNTSVFQTRDLKNVKAKKQSSGHSTKEQDEAKRRKSDVCEKCKKVCDENSLLKHISHAKKCKKFYGKRYDIMLADSKKAVQKVKNSRLSAKIRKSMKKRYLEKGEEIKEKVRERYHAKKLVISKRRKELHDQKQKLEDQKHEERIADQKLYKKPYKAPKAATGSILPYRIIKEDQGKIEVNENQAVCGKCENVMAIENFLKHVTKNEKCKDFYGNRLEDMRKERRKQVKKKNYAKYESQTKKAEISEKRKKKYHEEIVVPREEEQAGSRQKRLDRYIASFEERKQYYVNKAREWNLTNRNDRIRSKYHFKAIENLKKVDKLNAETEEKLMKCESEIEALYSNIEQEILDGADKIKDVKCTPKWHYDGKTQSWSIEDPGLVAIKKVFGPSYDDPLKIKDRWYKLIMKICHVIWKTYQDLGTECFNCPPESTGRRCWRCKEKEEKIKKEKKAEEMKNWLQRETSPVMKENRN